MGDRFIRHIADMLSCFFRSSDVLARVGGEEFCIMAPDMNPQNCHDRLDQLRKIISDSPLLVNGMPVKVTVSIGATARLGETLETTVNLADQQLYKAKKRGRNQVQSIL